MIEFVTTGPQAEAQAAAVARALTAALGHPPTERRSGGRPDDKGGFEAVTIALMIPPALVATLDLVQRARILKVVQRLLGELPAGVAVRRGGQSAAWDATPQGARAVIDLVADAPVAPLWDVFVSSAPADDAEAEALAQALRWQGLRVFWRGDLLPGDAWTDALWNAQRVARATVALVSSAAGWWEDEAVARGLDLKRAWDHGVIPVYRDGLPQRAADVPAGLRVLVAVDFEATALDDAAVAIAKALGRGPG